jgi:hypothetical protein
MEKTVRRACVRAQIPGNFCDLAGELARRASTAAQGASENRFYLSL